MTDLTDAADQAQIVSKLDLINDNLTGIYGRMVDGRRVVDAEATKGSDNPEAGMHTAVSAIIDLADAVRELKEEVSGLRDEIREHLSRI